MSINHDDFEALADKVLDGSEPDDTGTGRPADHPDATARQAYADAAAEDRAALQGQAQTDLDRAASSGHFGYTDDGGEPMRIVDWGKTGRTDPFESGTMRRMFEALAQRDASHEVAEPAALRKAWTKVEQAVEVARQAVADIADVDRERSAQEDAYLTAVAEAARTGKAAPERPTPTDWEALKRARRAHASGKIRAARAARAAYDEAARTTLAGKGRVEALEAALAEAHEAALAAVTEAEQRAQAVDTARQALISAARQGDSTLQERPDSYLNMPRISQHLQDASAELGKLEPQTRRILCQVPAGSFTLTERLAISQSGHPDWRSELQATERQENYSVTSYSRSWPLAEAPPSVRERWEMQQGFIPGRH